MKVKNILVSQPAPAVIEKSPFYEIIQKYNAKIDYHPFIRVAGVSLKEFRSQRVEILSHTAVVFSNRTTVDSFFRICEEARVTVPETMKYFCNTEAIALYLQKYIVYRKRKIFFADGKFDTFMELMLKHKDEKFLVALTEPNNGELPDTMEKMNLNLSRVVLAKTVAADLSDVNPSAYDLMVFYSPSEISALISAFPPERIPTVAAFGMGTATAAANAGLKIGTVAPSPVAPSMAKAVDIYVGDINSGHEPAPVVLNVNTKGAEFLKAQEGKPRRAKPRKVEPAVADKKAKRA